MDIEPGARGIVIGDRYRVAGALRRTGLIDAVDLEGERRAAACRVVAVPGDAERVDQWEDAWRAAQEAARLPRLREIVDDGEGGHWAVLDGSPATGLRLPPDARHQAALIGEALARTGLDVGDVTRGMLVARADDLLVLDGVVWLGGELSPRAAAAALPASCRCPNRCSSTSTRTMLRRRRRPAGRLLGGGCRAAGAC